EEKLHLEDNYKKHNQNKQRSREEKAKDVLDARDNPSVVVACFDLEAVLPTPCVFEIVSKTGYCYFWHEAARRGANEIGTCLLEYLASKCVGNMLYSTATIV
ncbi:hypothetical protein RI129_000047, partial [Pyrocoelia pectoralis]